MDNSADMKASTAVPDWARMQQAQAQVAAASQMQRQAEQPITSRVDKVLTEANEMAARLSDIANRIAGPVPDLAGGSASNEAQIEPPLTRKVDHLMQAMQRIDRQIARISGAL